MASSAPPLQGNLRGLMTDVPSWSIRHTSLSGRFVGYLGINDIAGQVAGGWTAQYANATQRWG